MNIIYHVCVFGGWSKTKMDARPLISLGIFNFSSETVERNLMKLDRNQDLNVLYQVCVFWGQVKNHMTTLTSDLHLIVFPRIPYRVPALVQSFCMLHVAM